MKDFNDSSVDYNDLEVDFAGIDPIIPGKWRIYDGVYSWNFDIGPSSAGNFSYKKNFSIQSTSGPNGSTVLFETPKDALDYSISGTIVEKGMFDSLNYWFNNSSLVHIVDDLGRDSRVFIVELNFKRSRKLQTNYFYTFDLKALVV